MLTVVLNSTTVPPRIDKKKKGPKKVLWELPESGKPSLGVREEGLVVDYFREWRKLKKKGKVVEFVIEPPSEEEVTPTASSKASAQPPPKTPTPPPPGFNMPSLPSGFTSTSSLSLPFPPPAPPLQQPGGNHANLMESFATGTYNHEPDFPIDFVLGSLRMECPSLTSALARCRFDVGGRFRIGNSFDKGYNGISLINLSGRFDAFTMAVEGGDVRVRDGGFAAVFYVDNVDDIIGGVITLLEG